MLPSSLAGLQNRALAGRRDAAELRRLSSRRLSSLRSIDGQARLRRCSLRCTASVADHAAHRRCVARVLVHRACIMQRGQRRARPPTAGRRSAETSDRDRDARLAERERRRGARVRHRDVCRDQLGRRSDGRHARLRRRGGKPVRILEARNCSDVGAESAIWGGERGVAFQASCAPAAAAVKACCATHAAPRCPRIGLSAAARSTISWVTRSRCSIR